MSSTSLDKKIAKATLILASCNIFAAIVFIVSYTYTGEWLFILAGSLMALAGIGVLLLYRRIKSILGNLSEE